MWPLKDQILQLCSWVVHSSKKSRRPLLVNLCPFRNSQFFSNYNMSFLRGAFPELHVVQFPAPPIPVEISTGSPGRLCHEPSFNDIQRMKSANLRTPMANPGRDSGIHCRMALCQNAICWVASKRKQSIEFYWCILSIIFNHFSTICFLPIVRTTAILFPTALHQVASQQLSEGRNFQAHRCLDTFTGSYCKSRFPTLQDTVHRFTHSWVHHSSTSRTTTRQ